MLSVWTTPVSVWLRLLNRGSVFSSDSWWCQGLFFIDLTVILMFINCVQYFLFVLQTLVRKEDVSNITNYEAAFNVLVTQRVSPSMNSSWQSVTKRELLTPILTLCRHGCRL